MRAASDAYAAQVESGGPLAVEVSSWYDGEQVAVLPVAYGSWKISDTAAARVPGHCSFSVPNTAEWRPTAPDHPLAAVGHRIRVRIGYGDELLHWGWYRLSKPKAAGVLLHCEAPGLMAEVERGRFLRPFQTVKNQTRGQALSAILSGVLPLSIEGLIDETLPVSTWDESRIDAVWEVIEAWPARLTMDETGTAVVTAPWSDSLGAPVADLRVSRLEPGTVDDAPNGFRVTRTPSSGEDEISEVWTITSGPLRWGGPYGQNPGFFASPVLPKARASLREVARTKTLRAQSLQRSATFTAAIDPRLEVGDVVRVRCDSQGVDTVGRLLDVTLTRQSMTGVVTL